MNYSVIDGLVDVAADAEVAAVVIVLLFTCGAPVIYCFVA